MFWRSAAWIPARDPPLRRRKQIWYFDFARVERGTEPLSPQELEVREHLTHEMEDHLLTTLDLEAALQALTPRQRECCLLFAEGKTEREVAQELGLSRGNIHAYLEAARKKLKKILAP